LLLDGLADLRAKYGDAKERERALARGRCVGTRPAWRKERNIGPGKMKTRPASHHKTHTPHVTPPHSKKQEGGTGRTGTKWEGNRCSPVRKLLQTLCCLCV
jgi:hypothetical protein